MKPRLSSLPDASKKFEKNVWADYVELMCFNSKDKEISLSDLLDDARKDDLEQDKRGGQESAEQDDRLRQHFTDVFSYLSERAKSFNECYPFAFVDEDTICVADDGANTLSAGQKLYLFLLFASNLSQFTKPESSRLTTAFEALSKSILQFVFPNFSVEIFGTSSREGEPFAGGNVIDRLERLSNCLNTSVRDVCRKDERNYQPGGDKGIDIVGFIQVEGENSRAPFLPSLFAQCACSVDKWKEKQSSINYTEMRNLFEFLSPFCEFIIVPFSLRGPDGKWSSTDLNRIYVIPIDRVRFIHIVQLLGKDYSFFESSDAYKLVNESLE